MWLLKETNCRWIIKYEHTLRQFYTSRYFLFVIIAVVQRLLAPCQLIMTVMIVMYGWQSWLLNVRSSYFCVETVNVSLLSPVPDRKIRSSRVLVNQTDDVHLCIMCLRAIMNYQVQRTTYPSCTWSRTLCFLTFFSHIWQQKLRSAKNRKEIIQN